MRGLMRAAGDERLFVVAEWGRLVPELEDPVRRALEVDAAYGIGLAVVCRWQDLRATSSALCARRGQRSPTRPRTLAFAGR
jgi:hypothetical protein